LGTPGEWSAPLRARGLLCEGALSEFLKRVRTGEHQRELLSLFALARWLESRK
jgi:hypothetical protein